MKIVTDTGAIIAGKVTQDTRIVGKGNKERAEFHVVVGESDFVKMRCLGGMLTSCKRIKKGDRIVAGKMELL